MFWFSSVFVFIFMFQFMFVLVFLFKLAFVFKFVFAKPTTSFAFVLVSWFLDSGKIEWFT